MAKLSNKFVLIGALAAVALVIPGMLGPAAFQQADAARENRNNAVQTARDNVVNAQVAVQANVPVDVENNNICIIADTCTTDDN